MEMYTSSETSIFASTAVTFSEMCCFGSNKPRYPLEHQLSPSNIAEVVVTPLQRCHSITEGQCSLSCGEQSTE